MRSDKKRTSDCSRIDFSCDAPSRAIFGARRLLHWKNETQILCRMTSNESNSTRIARAPSGDLKSASPRRSVRMKRSCARIASACAAPTRAPTWASFRCSVIREFPAMSSESKCSKLARGKEREARRSLLGRAVHEQRRRALPAAAVSAIAARNCRCSACTPTAACASGSSSAPTNCTLRALVVRAARARRNARHRLPRGQSRRSATRRPLAHHRRRAHRPVRAGIRPARGKQRSR